jgi:2-desacetyl-2-hydroxyethyl bacteriochlorophyllide A dehydrogenase
MKIITCIKPGEFEYGEKEMPVLKKDTAIIKIKRIGICGTDLHAYEGTQPYFTYPRILGHELAGELMEVDGAADFTIGEKVTFIPYFNCGQCIACRNNKPNCCEKISVCGVHEDGGMVEYLSVPAYALVNGNGLSFDELALVEPLAIGAHAVSRAGIKKDEFVLVMGAGPIGLGTMELARIAGAKVIALDVNQNRLEFCKNKLQLTFTVHANGQDTMQQIKEITHGDMPAVVIDATGNLKAINSGLQYLTHGGRYVLVGLQKEAFSFSHPDFHKRETTLMSSRNATRQDFEHVIHCMKEGKINPASYITHQVNFDAIKQEFGTWLNPANSVIKAMVKMGE